MTQTSTAISVAPQCFRLGSVVATRGVYELIQQGRIHYMTYLRRHMRGDWGDMCPEDRKINNAGVMRGGRLMSSYEIDSGLTLWIITEGDRSVTTLLLPSEY